MTISDEGVWRIRRRRGADHIELFKVEEVGHGGIITDEFMNWRIMLTLNKSKPPDQASSSAREPTPEREPSPNPGGSTNRTATPEQRPTPEPTASG
jgi:RAT1-interacting protein